MRRPGVLQVVFALKSFAAAMLALFIAIRVGLPVPSWAMVTAYVVSHPLSGAVRSKAVYRILGTLMGAAAALVLVPSLVDVPELLALALAAWVGVCLSVSLLDRTPRSYVFMLAGVTAAAVGFPSVAAPAATFDLALARVEEIVLGILCATLVHTVFFPRAVTPAFNARVDGFLRDAELWTLDVLGGRRGEQAQRDRRKLSSDVAELRSLASHLPFDTASLRPTSRAVRALQERMAMLLPVLASVEERLETLRAAGPLASPLVALLEDLRVWVEAGPAVPATGASKLRDACAALAPPLHAHSSWEELLTASLAVHLVELVDVLEDCRGLRAWCRNPIGRAPASLEPLLRSAGRRPRHQDHGVAYLSGLTVVVATLACCGFWIATAWPDGAGAAIMAAAFCGVYATQNDPVPSILSALWILVAANLVAGLYLFAVLPAVDGFSVLVLVLAPVLLGAGVLQLHPRWAGPATLFTGLFVATLGLKETYAADLASLLNGAVAQAVGIIAAALATRFFRSVGADRAAHRLLRTGWRELAGLSSPDALPDHAAWVSRAVDRLGLLAPRLALPASGGPLEATSAFNDLCIGLEVVELKRARTHADAAGSSAIDRLLRGVSRHFDVLSGGQTAQPPDALLAELDEALGHLAGAALQPETRRGVVALAGLRRGLFPGAAVYAPLSPREAAA